MNIKVQKSKVKGEIFLPASKSDMHRAILSASLASGTSIISNITLSNDVKVTINVLQKLGANIKQEENNLIIQGISDFSNVVSNELNINESGSTLRFIIPLLSMFNDEFILTGSSSLFSRPLNVYEEIYKNQNLKFELNNNTLLLQGKLNPGEYLVHGNISSQFISGLLFLLPLLKGDSIIKIVPPFESKSYVDMTIHTLNKFGIEIETKSESEYVVKGNQKYKACNYEVECDYSQFAFYAVLGAINQDITCKGLNINSLQGDKEILKILESFKVKYTIINNDIVINKANKLEGEIIDLSNCIDLGPILMILSIFNARPVRIINIKRLRLKESDRIEAMVFNLRNMGVKIDVYDNEMIIYPSKIKRCKKHLKSFNDHRVIMALTVLASVIKGDTIIENPECVKKSYINFFKDMQLLGMKIGIYNIEV